MSLPRDFQRLIEERVDGTTYRSARQVLFTALQLFDHYQKHERLRTDVRAGFVQLECGEGIELDDAGLRAFFNDIKACGREKYDARKQK